VREVEIAGGDLVKHGSEQKEVLLTDQSNLHRLARAGKPLEMPGGIDASEPTSEYQDANRSCRHSFLDAADDHSCQPGAGSGSC
jgi:hypothetical protein